MPSVDFVSDGPIGFPGTRVSLPVVNGGVDARAIGGSFPSRKSLVSGNARILRPDVGIDLQISIRGLNVAIEHWDAFQALLPGYMWIVGNETGKLMTAKAVSALAGQGPFQRAWLSGDTARSVHHFMSTTSDSVIVSTGPTTFYAPMIEYGLGPHAASHIGPRPFMQYAAAQILPFLFQAYADLGSFAKHGARGKITSPPYKSALESYIAKWRARLYKLEKELGDLVFLPSGAFVVPGSGNIREGAIGTARVLGDIQSVLKRAIGQRFYRRLTGKITGRAIGIGSRTIFVNKVVGARITGGERAYNRIAGRTLSGIGGGN